MSYHMVFIEPLESKHS